MVYAMWPAHQRGHPLEVGSAIDRANQVLRIVGKGNKERLVPLPQPILDELGHLWRTHRNRRWLFPNRTRRRTGQQAGAVGHTSPPPPRLRGSHARWTLAHTLRHRIC